ncbi:uncharacterized protein VTP21DRAFT_9187 [Calcarisporiella thermophila]|uniref:uncharacterized protein n=1 Tax=Calcarisporiella thermophila TaxID=911321 RepID=UPI0037447242
MTLLYLLLLILMPALAFAAPSPTSYTCYDQPNPLIPVRHAVPCPLQTKPRLFLDVATQPSSNNSFSINFACRTDKNCAEAQAAFETAGQIISASLILSQPVSVNASYYSFCREQGACTNGGFLVLGGARPARMHPLKDNDGMTRLYPQALVKQMNFSAHPQYSQYDIQAAFNADAPFWFNGATPIGENQSDFLFVVLHELMHGLGFTSSWSDYITSSLLTPDLTASENRLGQVRISQFYEYVFDRYAVTLPDLKHTTQNTQDLNNAVSSAPSDFISPSDLNSILQGSPDLVRIGTQMMNIATTPDSLGFLPEGKSTTQDAVVLETSIKPFSDGSSISHVDYRTYTNTADFLMRFIQDQGVTLQEAVRRGGGSGPIGPKLMQVLSSMGYSTRDQPLPVNLPSGFVKSSAMGLAPNILFMASLFILYPILNF